MNPAAEREEALFEAAVRLSGSDRAAFLDLKCAKDSAMRRRIEALLTAHEGEAEFMAEKSDSSGVRSRVRVEPIEGDEEVVGQTIGRYKLLEKLGEGGCGVVYVAEQSVPIRRRVALKVIKLGMDTKQVVARFEAERQALALMDHPNIAKVLDAGATERGRPYFVMELVRGIRITDYCDQNHLTMRERLQLIVQVCQAIQHAHQKGIIHRDIKPSNILVTLHDGTPVPKVIDFGIAKATEGRLSDLTIYTQLHQLVGTPAYMSPEQAEMSALDVDTRSDIYSLGVLLYELLVGRTPFDAKQLIESGIDAMRRTIREREPIRPSTRLAGLRGDDQTETAKRRRLEATRLVHLLRRDLDWIVMRCLEKDRTRRYETANALAMDILRHLNDEAVVARPPSRTYRFVKTVRRHTGAFVAAGLVVAALVVGIVVSLSQMVRAQKAENRTQREADRARAAEKSANEERMRAQRSLYAADMNLVQQALAQSNLRHARERLRAHEPRPGQEDLRGWEWRHFANLAKGDDAYSISANGNGAIALLSPPGATGVLVGWQNGAIESWSPEDKKSIRQIVSARGMTKVMLMDSGGSHLLTQGQDDQAQIRRVVPGAEAILERTVPLSQSARAFHAKKQLIAGVFAASGRPELPRSDIGVTAIWNAETGALIRQLEDSGDRAVFSRSGEILVTGSWMGGVTVWNTDSWTVVRKISNLGHVMHLALAPDDRQLLVCTVGGAYVCDLLSGEKRAVLLPGAALPVCGVFAHDSKRFAVGFADGTISMHRADSGNPTRLQGHEGSIHAMAFSENGKWLVSADTRGAMRIFQRDREPPSELRIGMFSPTVFSGDGKMLAVGDVSLAGVHCAVWNLSSRQKRVLPGASNPLGFTEDGKTLITALVSEPLPVRTGKIHGVEYWDLASGSSKRVLFQGEVPEVGAVALSPDGRIVAAGDRKGDVHFWDSASGQWKRTIKAGSDRVWNLVFSPDGKRLAVGIIGEVSVWDCQKGERIFSKRGFDVLGTPMGFSPNGGIFALSTETEILLCDPEGRVVTTLSGQRERVYWLAFSPDGRTLASAAEDIRLWNLGTFREVGSLKKTESFRHVNFSPDGVHLVGGPVGHGYVWSAPAGEQMLMENR